MRFFCDHDDCGDDTNDGKGYETLDELTEHQEADHSISYTELERWECVECGQMYEDRDDAYNCCG